MRILSISTSSNNCSTSIIEDGKILKELNINDTKTHSENLMPLINNILQETNIELSSIELLACDIGPGSFTGIRIGIATIKAISQITNIPICPVSSLEGLAFQAENPADIIVSLIDARNNQAYCGIFDSNYSIINNYIADSIYNIIDILKEQSTNITFIGDASVIHKELLQLHFPTATFSTSNTLSATSIAKIAEIKNTTCFADELLPLYLRKSQAERMAEQKK